MIVQRCRCGVADIETFHHLQLRHLRYSAASSIADAHLWRHSKPLVTCSQVRKQYSGGLPSDKGGTLQPRQPSLLEQLNDATKWTVVAAVTATVGVRHDAVSLWCVTGSIIAAAVCKAIKMVIRQQRPANARAADPGMPSSHATSLSFLATYAAAALSLQPSATLRQQAASVAIIAAGSFLAWLRVHTGYHTVSQTLAGGALGSAAAACWLKLYDACIADWCRSDAWHLHSIAALAVTAAMAFVLRLVRKPQHSYTTM